MQSTKRGLGGIVDEHTLSMQPLPIRHTLKNNLAPDSDGQFCRFFFEDLYDKRDQHACSKSERGVVSEDATIMKG